MRRLAADKLPGYDKVAHIMGNITGLAQFYITSRIMWQYDDLIHC